MSRLHPVEEPREDEYGAEAHPAFGMFQANRVSQGGSGAVLFDSEIQHGHYVVVRVGRATRKRDLNRDWIHGGSREIIEFAMSESQWAQAISSMNTSGTPCTIRYTEKDGHAAGLPYAPRLELSRAETVDAARRAFDPVKEAFKAVQEKPTKANIRALEIVLKNAEPNVDFATRSLAEHTEDVVQKARADIEAMVDARARELGIDPVQVALALQGDGGEPAAIEGPAE